MISVPSYAAGVYHRAQRDTIAKLYHPFRQERISLQKALAFASAFCLVAGHSMSMDTLGQYGHSVDGERERAAALIGSIYDALLHPQPAPEK